MSIADDKYKELIEDIHKNGVWDKNESVRTVYEDGSPAYTKSIFGKQVVFEEGEIPLLTTKHVGWKTAFKEMRLFWILQTVKKEDFEKENVKVWDEWFLDDGTLGKSYAYQFESRPIKEIVKVKQKLKEENILNKIPNIIIEDVIFNHDICGKVYSSNNYGNFKIIEFLGKNSLKQNKSEFRIQFLDTGTTMVTTLGDINKGNVKDRYSTKKNYNIGYYGNAKNNDLSKDNYCKLIWVWRNMLKRCYDKTSKDYVYYGGKGVFVDSKWHCFGNFLSDIKKLPQYFLAKQNNFENWNLDKDYYASNCYSAETCVWLDAKENSIYKDTNQPIKLCKDNMSIVFLSNKEASIRLGIDESDLGRHLSKIPKKGLSYYPKSVKGWTGEYMEVEEGYRLRYTLSSNQVVDLINNIKTNPMSRRLMTSFWNDTDVSEKALQECAMQTTWNVRDGKLDLLLYSRSVDTALGLPFNWIQYWFLLQLVAKSTGLKAGRFIHQMGNVHYYDRHEDTLLKQINSNTYEQPVFNFTSENKEFFNFNIDDIEIKDYVNGGKFEYEVAI